MYIEMDCPCKGKNLDKMLQPGILISLFHEDKYGYSIIRDLEENPMFDGTSPDKTGVYRYLKRMEASGYLVSRWEFEEDNNTPRKIYSITDKGRSCLSNWKATLLEYASSVADLVEKIDRTIAVG